MKKFRSYFQQYRDIYNCFFIAISFYIWIWVTCWESRWLHHHNQQWWPSGSSRSKFWSFPAPSGPGSFGIRFLGCQVWVCQSSSGSVGRSEDLWILTWAWKLVKDYTLTYIVYGNLIKRIIIDLDILIYISQPFKHLKLFDFLLKANFRFNWFLIFYKIINDILNYKIRLLFGPEARWSFS